MNCLAHTVRKAIHWAGHIKNLAKISIMYCVTFPPLVPAMSLPSKLAMCPSEGGNKKSETLFSFFTIQLQLLRNNLFLLGIYANRIS